MTTLESRVQVCTMVDGRHVEELWRSDQGYLGLASARGKRIVTCLNAERDQDEPEHFKDEPYLRTRDFGCFPFRGFALPEARSCSPVSEARLSFDL